MKKFLSVIFVFAVNSVFVFSQTETKTAIAAPVKSVIVYLQGAEVTHEAPHVVMNPGINKIIFKGLSSKLYSKSIQINLSKSVHDALPSDLSSANVSIISVSDEVNYLSKTVDDPKIKSVKDSIQMLSDIMKQITSEKDAFNSEKNLMLANNYMSGKDKALTVAELKAMADFYRARIKEINDGTVLLEKKEVKWTEALTRLNDQLNEWNSKNNVSTSDVTILFNVLTKVNARIELKYVVADAGWAPSYDLIATDVNQPIEIKYRAKVFNNTDIAWNEVKMRLSTSDPMRSASKPEMETWNLNYSTPGYSSYSNASGNYQYESNYKNQGYINAAPVQQSYDGLELKTVQIQGKQKGIKEPIRYETIQVSELSADFEIKNPYSIPSDSKPYIIEVANYKVNANYQHFSVPKTDRDAFLLARVTNWEDLDLVEGPANIYFGGTYIGQSYIKTRSTDDTLDLSLGRDNKILVTRTKQKDFSSTKLIGNSVKEVFSYEIVVKNNRKTPVNIEINDQLPISQQADIEVEAIELSKANRDLITGKLSWDLTLQPDEVKKIILTFSIKRPKNKTIVTKKYRTISAPAF